jgi:hypothetical protein
MGSETAPGDGAEPLRVEVIDDRGRVVEEVYVSEITGVRAISEADLALVRGGASPRKP